MSETGQAVQMANLAAAVPIAAQGALRSKFTPTPVSIAAEPSLADYRP